MVKSSVMILVDHNLVVPLKSIHAQISNFLIPYTLDVYYKLKSFPYFAILAFAILIAVNFMKWLIFGNLTVSEITTLRKKFHYTLWEFVLCLVVFRMNNNHENFDKLIVLNFAFLFSCVLLLKMFHYLCVYRVSKLFDNSGAHHQHTQNSMNCKKLMLSSNNSANINPESDFDDDDFDDLTTYNKNFIFNYDLLLNDDQTVNNISSTHACNIDTGNGDNSKIFLVNFRFAIGIFLLNFIDITLIVKFFQIVHKNYIQLNKKPDVDNNISLLILFGFEIINLYPLIILTSFNYLLKYWEFHKFNNSNKYSSNERKSFQLSKQKYLLILKISLSYLKFLNQIIFSIFFIQVFCIFPLHLIPISYSSLRILIFKFRCILNLKKFELKLIYFESKLKPIQAISESVPDHDQNIDVCLICREDLVSSANDDVEFDKTNVSSIGQLPCSHKFHRDCILQWLINSSNTCPTCRTIV